MFDKTMLMCSRKNTLQVYTGFCMFNSEITLLHLTCFSILTLNSHKITEQQILIKG